MRAFAGLLNSVALAIRSKQKHKLLSALAFGIRIIETTQYSSHLWKLRLSSRTGIILGEMDPLPYSGGSQIQPSTSADGRMLAYTQVEPTGRSIRLRDLRAGRERTLVNGPARPKISPDGAQVAYSVLPSGLYVVPSSGGESTLLAEGDLSLAIYAWTPDGRKIVYWTGKPIRFALLDPVTRQTTELMAHAKYDIYGAEMSPDQGWIAFDTTLSRHEKPLWIAALRGGKIAEEQDWIRVSSDGDNRPWWSSDGNLLYTVSWRDGFLCIWAQKLDPGTPGEESAGG